MLRFSALICNQNLQIWSITTKDTAQSCDYNFCNFYFFLCFSQNYIYHFLLVLFFNTFLFFLFSSNKVWHTTNGVIWIANGHLWIGCRTSCAHLCWWSTPTVQMLHHHSDMLVQHDTPPHECSYICYICYISDYWK